MSRRILHPPLITVIFIPISLLLLARRQRLPKLPIGRWRFLGIPLVAAGIGLHLWSDRLLRTRGQGTPDPANPPRLLVEEGPYQYSRNPIWIGRFLLLVGVGLFLRSLLLLLYVIGLVARMHTHIVRVEEPQLLERFGGAYRDYMRSVPRWLPLRLKRRV